LDEADLTDLKVRLAEKPHGQTKEVVEPIHRIWGVDLSLSQVGRILKDKLQVPFGKPYPHDDRRPPDAEERLEELLVGAYNGLISKGLIWKDRALGWVDEARPQTTANTVRTWPIGPADSIKNTTHYQANAVGFSALVGRSVSDCLPDSTQDDQGILSEDPGNASRISGHYCGARQFRQPPSPKRSGYGQGTQYRIGLPAPVLAGSQSN